MRRGAGEVLERADERVGVRRGGGFYERVSRRQDVRVIQPTYKWANAGVCNRCDGAVIQMFDKRTIGTKALRRRSRDRGWCEDGNA